MWSRYHCPNCEHAVSILKSQGYIVEERKIGDGYTREDLLDIIPTAKSVPQIFINDALIGGLTELRQYINRAST